MNFYTFKDEYLSNKDLFIKKYYYCSSAYIKSKATYLQFVLKEVIDNEDDKYKESDIQLAKEIRDGLTNYKGI